MSFSGGVYTLPGPALVTGEVVSATENNQFRNDVAGAFNLTMLRNGTSTATANLPMGGYKLTGLGAPNANGDSLAYGAAAVVSTLGATGDVTLSSGTANGVAYINGSKVLTTGSALTFDGTTLRSTQLNVGTAPNANSRPWAFNGFGYISGPSGNGIEIFNTSTSAYGYWTFASDNRFVFNANGGHSWEAGGAEQMRLTSTGLGIGTSSPYSNAAYNSLTVGGSKRVSRFADGYKLHTRLQRISTRCCSTHLSLDKHLR